MRPAPGWKRRVRTEASLARKPGKRSPKPLILIVCEDSVSSPRYFEDLRSLLRISTVSIEVCGRECGSAPISVVDYALGLRKKRSEQGHTVDITYCVVDVDGHSTLHKANDKGLSNRVQMVISSPCFERWYLVHFEPGDRPYAKCDDLIAALKRHLPHYEKGRSGMLRELWDKVSVAIRHAERLCTARRAPEIQGPWGPGEPRQSRSARRRMRIYIPRPRA